MRVRRGGLALVTLAIAGVYAVPLASAHLVAHPGARPAQAVRAHVASPQAAGPHAAALGAPLGAHWAHSVPTLPSVS